MFVLYLNDMRSPKSETTRPVARAETVAALEAFMERESVEPYRDDGWRKQFRAGGPLEWYNPPCGSAIVPIESPDMAANRARMECERFYAEIPLV